MNKIVKLVSKIVLITTLVLLAIVLAAGPIMLSSSEMVNNSLGIQTSFGSVGSADNLYYETEYESIADVHEAGYKVIEEVVAEGTVLMKNNGALPLAKGSTVNLYGAGSTNPVFTGQGSAGDNGYCQSAGDIEYMESLVDAGLDVNEDLESDISDATDAKDWYEYYGYAKNTSQTYIGGQQDFAEYFIKDISWDNHGDHKTDAAKTAVYVIVRTSGEGYDINMDLTMDDGSTSMVIDAATGNATATGDSLILNDNEKTNLAQLKALKTAGTIDNIVVILNTTSTMQADFLDNADYGIDSCLWVGTYGAGGAAIGKLLTGEYNPSGGMTDTAWMSQSYNPVNYNFGSIQYIDEEKVVIDGVQDNYIVYQEGIYNGYRYTETRYEDIVLGRSSSEETYGGNWVYDDVVACPFGYGLSYSTFEYSNFKAVNNNNGTYTVTVDVENTSDVDGKEAVEVYIQKPYTAKDIASGIEKASVELVGFDKVFVEAGETETAEVTVDEKYLAAYDAYVEQTYVIGSTDADDKYLFTAATDSHAAVNNMIMYKDSKGYADADTDKMSGTGDASMVNEFYYAYDNTTFATNEFIEEENENDKAEYTGDKANYGIESIANQFDTADFTIATTDREATPEYIFGESERSQKYMTRSNWTGTYGDRIDLTVTDNLLTQQISATPEEDTITEAPTYNEKGYYINEDTGVVDDIKLIYLRGKDYHDKDWDILLDQISYSDMGDYLSNGLRRTYTIESIAAPSSSQQNGSMGPIHGRDASSLPDQNGFQGFAVFYDDTTSNATNSAVNWTSNALVACTFNQEVAYTLGELQGEYGLWNGYNGLYGLGINIHRGQYNGRAFEFYSEDGFLSGEICGYQTVAMNKYGMFSLAKHCVLNDQETHRSGVNTWATEQSIREVYLRPFERVIDIEYDYSEREDSGFTVPTFGVMTGFNMLGARWCGTQGFVNTVLRAEFGMRGFAVSDYYTPATMTTVGACIYGNDLPDGDSVGTGTKADDGGYYGFSTNYNDFDSSNGNYGAMWWAMRNSAKNILYTVVNSNTMNTFSGDSSFYTIQAAWELAIPISIRVLSVAVIWSGVLFVGAWAISSFIKKED